VFDGALVPAVATFIQSTDLSPDEVQQLKQILEKQEQR
jgi:predicted transcriptional regulator